MALNPYDTPSDRLRRGLETTRRQFLLLMGALAAAGATLFGGIELLKFMFPGATGEAPPKFKTDFTVTELTGGGSMKVNVISDTANRTTVVLDDAGIYAVYLVCTHLGCTPNYVTDVVSGSGVDPKVAEERGMRTGASAIPNGWACPCHGSRYYIDSTNFYGPAPRPMDWIKIEITPDKHFAVDRSAITVYRQAGDTTAPKWRLDPVTGKDNGATVGV